MSAGSVAVPKGREIHGISASADLMLLADREGRRGPTALLSYGGRPGCGPAVIVRLVEELRGAGATGPLHLVGGDKAVAASLPEASAHAAAGAAAVLSCLATLADRGPGTPLVLVAGDLMLDRVALLDLLDNPSRRTAAYVGPPPSDRAAVRVPVRRQGAPPHIASVGTAVHRVSDADLEAIGVLRVDAGDRAEAARLWRAAAAEAERREWQVDPFGLALLALVRGAVPVAAVPFGLYPWMRPDDADEAARGHQVIGGIDAWSLRLAQASRADDGFYSTFFVRPVSRRVTGVALRVGLRPNAVTLLSLLLGLLAAVLVARGSTVEFILAAVLVQASLVIDCVDGELARFTRRFSAFGAWLDATGDRVKEYAVYAALAVTASRDGDDVWPLAMAAMAVVSYRHYADYGFLERTRAGAVGPPAASALDVTDDETPVRSPTAEPPSRSGWTSKILHLPIGERCLLLSLALLSGRPRLILWTMIAAVALSILYTTGRRTVAALSGRAPYRPDVRGGWAALDHELDLGPLARRAGRVLRLPFGAALVGVLLPVAGLVALDTEPGSRLLR